ncbi:HET-domain-containing protein, partial [Colletotrichum falcatum]
MEYTPLCQSLNEIRLLTIFPEEDPTKPIDCRLRHVTLPCQTPYYALSYRWGSLDDTVHITVSGCIVSVTKNLAHAIQELRRRRIYNIWVDAICINQDDPEERAQQVLRMRAIYQHASQTMAWLGYPSDPQDAI